MVTPEDKQSVFETRGINKILFITHNFPPLNRVSSLRTGQWAKYWARAGVEVTVLTTRKYRFDGPCDLIMAFPDTVQVVEVDYLPPWLTGDKASFSNKPDTVSEPAPITPGKLMRLKYAVRRLRRHMGSLFDIHDLWVGAAVRKGRFLMKKKDYDVIISSFGPPASHKVAAGLKRACPVSPWIADFRDLWVNNHIVSAKGIFRWIENWTESRTVGRYADMTVTVSDPLAKDLQARRPHCPAIVVENGFDPDEFPGWEQALLNPPAKTGKTVIIYTGTIYPGKQDPRPLFNAVRRLIASGSIGSDEIEIRFYGENQATLKQMIDETDCHRWVHSMGHVNRAQVLRAQAESSALLLLEWGDPSTRGVLTGKVFEYLVSGRPILGVGIHRDNAAGALIEDTGTGLSCGNDVTNIQEFLLELANRGTWSGYNPRVDVIRKYGRDNQAKKLLAEMARLKSNGDTVSCAFGIRGN